MLLAKQEMIDGGGCTVCTDVPSLLEHRCGHECGYTECGLAMPDSVEDKYQ